MVRFVRDRNQFSVNFNYSLPISKIHQNSFKFVIGKGNKERQIPVPQYHISRHVHACLTVHGSWLLLLLCVQNFLGHNLALESRVTAIFTASDYCSKFATL